MGSHFGEKSWTAFIDLARSSQYDEQRYIWKTTHLLKCFFCTALSFCVQGVIMGKQRPDLKCSITKKLSWIWLNSRVSSTHVTPKPARCCPHAASKGIGESVGGTEFVQSSSKKLWEVLGCGKSIYSHPNPGHKLPQGPLCIWGNSLPENPSGAKNRAHCSDCTKFQVSKKILYLWVQ